MLVIHPHQFCGYIVIVAKRIFLLLLFEENKDHMILVIFMFI